MAMSTDALAGVSTALQNMQPMGAVLQALEHAASETNRDNHNKFCELVDQVCDYVTANHLAGTTGFTEEGALNMLIGRACVLSANDDTSVQDKATPILAHLGEHFSSTINTFYGMAWEHHCQNDTCHEGMDAGKEHFNAMSPKERQELMDGYLQIHGGTIFQTYFKEFSDGAESVHTEDGDVTTVDETLPPVDTTTNTDEQQPPVVDDTQQQSPVVDDTQQQQSPVVDDTQQQPPVVDDTQQQPPVVDDTQQQPAVNTDSSASVHAPRQGSYEIQADELIAMAQAVRGLADRLEQLLNPTN